MAQQSVAALLIASAWVSAEAQTPSAEAAANESTRRSSTPADKNAADPAAATRVTVTGSRLQGDAETASPITVLTAEDIKRSGAATVAELLRALPASGEGSLNDIAAENDFAAGASSVSLRGLGSDVTLILLNGRRIASHGFARTGLGTQFVNLDALPVTLIERIEILKDGASAIYGSEAVAGVINVILRRDFKGLEISATAAQNADGVFGQRRASATWGMGDLQRDGYNLMISGEHFVRDRVRFRDVEQFLAEPNYRRAFGTGVGQSTASSPGTLRYITVDESLGFAPAPGCSTIGPVRPPDPDGSSIGNGCMYDLWSNIDLVPKVVRNSLFARGTLTLNAELEAFSELALNRHEVRYRGPPLAGESLTFFKGDSFKGDTLRWDVRPGDPRYPADGDGRPAALNYRFSVLGDLQRTVVTDGLRVLGGFRGQARGWDWETAATLSQTDTTDTYRGYVRGSTFGAALDSGSFDFANPQNIDPSLLRSISPTVANRAKSTLAIVDAKGSTEIGRLPGGPVAIALGAEFRHEALNNKQDNLIESADMSYLSASSTSARRLITSAYSEASLPLLPQFDVQLAARADHYNDVGSALSPKLGLKYKLLPELALRGTFSRGFRAPALTESRSGRSRFIAGNVVDGAYCLANEYRVCLPQSVPVTSDGNPDLKPERSSSFTAGFVFSPTKESKVTVDFFDIRRINQIRLLDPSYLLANESNFPDRVVRETPTPDPKPDPKPEGPDEKEGAVPPPLGNLIGLRSGFANLGRTAVRGIDIEAMGRFTVGSWGTFSGNVSLTRLLSSRQAGVATGDQELLGYYERPKVRSYAALTWDYRNVSATINYRYTGSFSFRQTPTDVCYFEVIEWPEGCRIDAHHRVGLVTSWRPTRSATLTLGIDNLLNRQPSFDGRRPSIMFNPTYSDPRDRNYTLTANYRFN